MNPILSICIPTYNRFEALEATLGVLVKDPTFLSRDDIEVVISDNASPDRTEAICRSLVERFPNKIVYHRQTENVGYSRNVETLTRMAHGEYLKFLNDNMIFRPGAFGLLVDFVDKYHATKPVLFFADPFAARQKSGVIECETYDEFLRNTSHCSTWLGAYGFWRRDVDEALTVHLKFADSLIPQTAVIWYFFDKVKKAAVLQDLLFKAWNGEAVKKSGYNIAQVFAQNYLSILRQYIGPQKISMAAYEYEKKKVFKNWIFPRYFDFLNKYNYNKGDYFKYTTEYHHNFYYWYSFLLVVIFKLASCMPNGLRRFAISIYAPFRQMMIRIR